MKRFVTAVFAATALGLAGCATHSPYAYVHGYPWYKAQLNSYPVLVLDVDNRSTTRDPVVVDPGMRTLRLQGPAAPGFRYGEVRTLQLDVQPCMRYYLKAVKPTSVSQEFTPEVDYAEPIAGCRA